MDNPKREMGNQARKNLRVRGFMALLIKRLFSYRRTANVAIHLLLVALAYLMAFLLRFDFGLPAEMAARFVHTLPLLLIVKITMFGWFHLYEDLWRYVGMRDILEIFKSATLSSLIFAMSVLFFFGHGFPRSVLLLDWIICLALVSGVRLTLRARQESSRRYSQIRAQRALIVGAGDAGEMLIREIDRSLTLNYEVVGFVDDDLKKQGRRIHGIEVLGTVDQLSILCQGKGVQYILIATPSGTREQKQRIVSRCRMSGVPFRTIPPLNELIQGTARIGQLQDVRPEDLLGREVIHLDLEQLRTDFRGKRILVTGAAGSIGSELCRQLARFEPEMLILFDRAESPLYFIDLELKRDHPYLKIDSIVGDISDDHQMNDIIHTFSPEILYHAAAYKHVPLMEAHPLEAIQNNIFGAEKVARAAEQGQVSKFVFISTDKAVNPVGIMGMTKRLAECLLLSLNGCSTKFVAVRFGNVLGSDGSVLPLFQWQIANGGPVTVSHPDASRYFMLLSEAAQLVLQAGALARGGEIFFLNMGEPIRIVDLAQNLIHLSGLKPGSDVSIEMIGLRPGERLREELFMEKEKLIGSRHEKVYIVQNSNFNRELFSRDINDLKRFVVARNREQAVMQLNTMAARY